MDDAIVASDAEIARGRRVRRGRRRVAAIVVAATLLLLLQIAAWPWYRLSFSMTRSLPQRVYLIRVGTLPARGDLVAFRPPSNRFYPDRGGFIKRVRGVGGDVVRWEGRRCFVGDQPMGLAKEQALDGRPLATGPAGRITAGHYFVWTPERDSFDSRYADIGWIGAEHVVGVAVPLL